jgi:integrase
MAVIKFSVRGKQNPTSIYVRLRSGRNIDIKCKTKFVINTDKWSVSKGAVKSLKDERLKELNDSLEELKFDLIKYFNSTIDHSIINSVWLSDFLNPQKYVAEVDYPTLLVKYFEYYEEVKLHELTKASITKLRSNKKLILRFEKQQKKKVQVIDVNSKFKFDFEKFCRKENYAQNTIARTIRFIKTICYHARSNGVESSFQLDKISAKGEKIEKIYLDDNELALLSKVELPHDYLINARDWLLISCETGQRVSDFMRFNKDMVRYQATADGKKQIALVEFTQQKTQKIMSIPLSKKVKDILELRDGEFPRKISSVKYNVYIKEVCKLAKITHEIYGSRIDTKTNRKKSGMYSKNELVTSHIGRRSFATNNYGKIPTPLLMSATGHTTEKMFLEYIGKTETDRAMQLAEYFV